jgi:hypothetical protein
MERLLCRVEAGESLSQVCADLNLKVKEKDLPRLRGKYEKGGRTWEALIDGRYDGPPDVTRDARPSIGGKDTTSTRVIAQDRTPQADTTGLDRFVVWQIAQDLLSHDGVN